MEVEPKNIVFEPDEELISFAAEFSKSKSYLGNGDYESDTGKYVVSVQDGFDGAKTLGTIIRVSNQTGRMQLRKSDVHNYGEDFVFYLILWLQCKNQNKECSEVEIDRFVFDFCVTKGRYRLGLRSDILLFLSRTTNDFVFNLAQRRIENMKNL